MTDAQKQRDARAEIINKYNQIHALIGQLDICLEKRNALFDRLAEFSSEFRSA